MMGENQNTCPNSNVTGIASGPGSPETLFATLKRVNQ